MQHEKNEEETRYDSLLGKSVMNLVFFDSISFIQIVTTFNFLPAGPIKIPLISYKSPNGVSRRNDASSVNS